MARVKKLMWKEYPQYIAETSMFGVFIKIKAIEDIYYTSLPYFLFHGETVDQVVENKKLEQLKFEVQEYYDNYVLSLLENPKNSE